MSQTTTDSRQLGDATVLRLRIRGITSADTITIHRARKQAVRVDLASKGDIVSSAVGLGDLPELINALIARSGRTDLALVVTEPEPDSEEQYEGPGDDQDALACGDCGHVTCECPDAVPA